MAKESAKKIVHIHLPKDEPFQTHLTAGEHQLIADEPESVKGGRNTGPDPYDLLLMALGSCTVMTMKMYAGQKGWPLEDAYVELRHGKSHSTDCANCEKPSSKIDKIEKEVILKGDLSDEQKDKLIEISKKCPVHKTLLSDIEIETILGTI
ncbi:MAG: OsmC family protein [Balneolaceae bacterium]|nr:OsmC family protein [Balneolaceae bacterium]